MAIQGKKASELPVMASAAGSSFYGFDNTTATGSKRALGGGANGLGTLDASAKQPSSQMALYTANFAGTVSRAYSVKLDELPSVLDFGADATGVADSFAAFTSAAAAGERVRIPAGTYNLSADVNGRWELDAGVSFTGAGRILVTERGFWADVGSGVDLHKLRDRVFIGDATDNSGKQTIGTQKSWLGFEASGFMTYFETSPQLEVVNTVGRIGTVSASRTSDQLDVNSSCIGYGSYVANDRNDGTRRGAWGFYGHAASKGINSSTFGMELDVADVSGQTVAVSSPYSMTQDGMTACLWMGVGGETVQAGVPATDYASMCMGIVTTAPSDPLSKYDKGIVVQNGAIQSTTRGFSIAVEMPRLHRMQWVFDGTANPGGYIDSEATAATVRAGIVFVNDGIEYRDFAGSVATAVHRMTMTVNNVNGVNLNGSDAGAPAEIVARGSDTNLGLNIRAKGTGSGRLQAPDTTRKVEWSSVGLGFYGTAPIAKPTATGSRGGNAALASLLTQLAALGLITDGTTA